MSDNLLAVEKPDALPEKGVLRIKVYMEKLFVRNAMCISAVRNSWNLPGNYLCEKLLRL